MNRNESDYMKNVSFLDCTLRDGAHVVSAKFKHDCIVDVVSKLTNANTEIIEFGFLKQLEQYDPDTINYTRIEDAYTILDEVESKSGFKRKDDQIYALMARADEYDIARLTPCNGRIKLIRVAFYYDCLDEGIAFAKRAAELGYICSLNLINTPGATIEELRTFIDYANEIEPYAVSIVDTFGVLTIDEMNEILKLYDSTLELNIRIGLHVHENLALSFALAQSFLENVQEDRAVIVDGSLMGIGRAPGNLCTELITNYLNSRYGKNYELNTLMSAISNDIMLFKSYLKWGYSPEYFLSAVHRVHRSYAEYLDKCGIPLDEMDRILNLIDPVSSKKYNKDYINKIIKENCKK